AALPGSLDKTDVRNFQLSVVVDAQMLGFVVAILDNTKTEVVVRPELLSLVEHIHGIGSHDGAGGGRLDGGGFGNRRHWAALLGQERQRRCDRGSKEECESPGSHAVAIVSLLEAVGAIERDAILPVIAQRLIRIFLGVLITKPEGYMRRQLVSDRDRDTLQEHVLGDERTTDRQTRDVWEEKADYSE